MNQFLYEYDLNLVTWVYISSLMTIAIFFKFTRFWSIRNLDLVGLICLAPGLLMVSRGEPVEQIGYVWLFGVSIFFLVRLLIDPMFSRRPLLEPNLSPGGLTFMTLSLLVFLMANVLTKEPLPSDNYRAQVAEESADISAKDDGQKKNPWPGYPFLNLFGRAVDDVLAARAPELSAQERHEEIRKATARATAIVSQLAVVIGLVFIGRRHFGNMATGMAAAALYLLLPYTAQMVSRVDHVLPAALLVWAVAAYRKPVLTGVLLGLGSPALYCPLFLLPLWISFYWARGLYRFLGGVATILVLRTASLAFSSHDFDSFVLQVKQFFGWAALSLENANGFWAFNEPAYRIPVVAAFLALCCGLALWPARKNLGTLMSCSAAVMLATQFWHSPGGIYVAWYLPLLLLTIFRPNLEDRVALAALGNGWRATKRDRTTEVEKAA